MNKISIAIPYHDTPQTAFFLSRLLKSISTQTYHNYEIVLTRDGMMGQNLNAAIQKSRGDLIKIMAMDDYFAHSNALKEINDNFKETDMWMVSACIHTMDGVNTYGSHHPKWSDDIHTGNNTLGGISTLTIRHHNPLLFNESLSWVIDCDYYKRCFLRDGPPRLLMDINVVVDQGNHSSTHTLSPEIKKREIEFLTKKYEQVI